MYSVSYWSVRCYVKSEYSCFTFLQCVLLHEYKTRKDTGEHFSYATVSGHIQVNSGPGQTMTEEYYLHHWDETLYIESRKNGGGENKHIHICHLNACRGRDSPCYQRDGEVQYLRNIKRTDRNVLFPGWRFFFFNKSVILNPQFLTDMWLFCDKHRGLKFNFLLIKNKNSIWECTLKYYHYQAQTSKTATFKKIKKHYFLINK